MTGGHAGYRKNGFITPEVMDDLRDHGPRRC